MRVLFVHTGFPGQFGNLAAALKARGDDVRVLTANDAPPAPGIETTFYPAFREPAPPQASILAFRFEADTQRAERAMKAARELAQRGFSPDLIIGHPAFGETMLLELVWPEAKQLLYAENFPSACNLSAKFDPEFGAPTELEYAYAQTMSASAGLSLLRAYQLVSPTEFQRASFPPALRDRIAVVPDGVDTEEVRPREDAQFMLHRAGLTLRPGDEVITYVNRFLEPLRGLHIFLRALEMVLSERPSAQAIVVGAPAAQNYGRRPPAGKTWLDVFLEGSKGRLDLSRVHFPGRLHRKAYLDVLAVSAAHVYLTYPFVASWSLFEAMSAGCMIVGSRTAPVEEVVTDGRNGVLVDFFDHEGVADAIIGALARPADFAHLRQQARADAVARYDFQTVALPCWLEPMERVMAAPAY
jgi:glycosyltransferase involved in cell wall biosynthesis